MGVLNYSHVRISLWSNKWVFMESNYIKMYSQYDDQIRAVLVALCQQADRQN